MIARAALAIALVAVSLAGCGTSTLTARELGTRATLLCTTALRRSDRIPLPSANSGGAAYLAEGIAAFGPELAALKKLAPAPSVAGAYRVALADSAQQLDALIGTEHNLRHGDDPVIAIKQLDVELTPINARDRASWRAIGASACANLR